MGERETGSMGRGEGERERERERGVKRHGRKSSSSIRKRNTENAHGTQEEYWNASRRRRRWRDENIGDVETPVAKQFFDRIRARTCVGLGLSLFLRFLSFFAQIWSIANGPQSFLSTARVARRRIGNFPAMQRSCKMV